MTIEGNDISCDGYACKVQDSFAGSLSSDDVRLRYTILGWTFRDVDGHEAHFCPDHP